jgi:hypothetical protein
MSSAQLFRTSGLALVLGAVVFIVHIVLRSLLTAGADPAMIARESPWVWINALGVAGAALVLLGLPAMYARMADVTGVSTFVGMVLLALSWLFFGVFLSLYAVLVVPWLADQAPSLLAPSSPLPMGIIMAFIAGLLAQLLGTVLLAIPFVRGRVQPRWVGYALPAAALLAVVGNVIAPSGPSASVVMNLLSNLGPVVLLVALGALGARMWAEHAPNVAAIPTTAPPGRVDRAPEAEVHSDEAA